MLNLNIGAGDGRYRDIILDAGRMVGFFVAEVPIRLLENLRMDNMQCPPLLVKKNKGRGDKIQLYGEWVKKEKEYGRKAKKTGICDLSW